MDLHELHRLLPAWRSDAGPLYRQLAVALRDLIDAGHLPGGTTLPSERALAHELHLSRNTIVAAYSELRETGRVTSRRGSGTSVTSRDALSPRAQRIAGTLTPNSVFDGFLSPAEDSIDLRAGYWIGTDELPPDIFDLTDDPGHRQLLLGSGYHPHGLLELRAVIADRLTSQGLPTGPEQLLVTTGAQQALALVVSLLVDPGDPVLVEDTTYPGALDLFRAYGAHLHTMHRDEHGPDLTDLRRRIAQVRPRLTYLVLTGHNPTGSVAPALIRDGIARLTRDGQVLVDDVSLADTATGPVPPPLAAYAAPDAPGHVITIGSLSKAVWGGLRIGWLRAPTPLIDRLVHLKTINDIGTPATSQHLAYRLHDNLDELLDRRRRAIAQRRDHLEIALHRDLPDWSWRTPEAGLCLWIDLGTTNSIEFAAHAARHGIQIAPGTISSPTGQHRHRLRLPYGQPEAVLTEAVARLTTTWHDLDRADRRPPPVVAL